MVESGRVREPELEDEIDGLGGRVGDDRVGGGRSSRGEAR